MNASTPAATGTQLQCMSDEQKYVIIIPARLNSVRLPQKPLADINGLPMIIRTAQQALKTGADVVVATDAQAVIDVCHAHNLKTCLTDATLNSGTERVAQAAHRLQLPDNAVVINLQGDEPMMPPSIIELVAQHLLMHADDGMATAAHRIQAAHIKDVYSPNSVKVVLNEQQKALYFSRSPLPWHRDAWMADDLTQAMQPENAQKALPNMYKHIGVYGFRVASLKRFANFPATALEQLEMLEQLRALYYGMPIHVVITDDCPPTAVDTAADLEVIRSLT